MRPKRLKLASLAQKRAHSTNSVLWCSLWPFIYLFFRLLFFYGACIGILGIQDNRHFTSRDIGYFPFYFQGHGILCSIFGLLQGY